MFLHRRPGAVDLAEAVAALGERAEARLAGAGWTRATRRLPEDPLAAMFGADRPDFGAVLEVGADDADRAGEVLAAALAGAGDAHRAAIDPERCTVVAGTEHVIRPGVAPNQLFFLMRAKPGMTVAAFHDYWRNVHAVHHAHLDGVAGYRQLHADADLTARLCAAAGVTGASYDGVAENFMDSVAGLGTGRPEGRGDRENFVDPSSEFAVVTSVVASSERAPRE